MQYPGSRLPVSFPEDSGIYCCLIIDALSMMSSSPSGDPISSAGQMSERFGQTVHAVITTDNYRNAGKIVCFMIGSVDDI
jgi:hypothetical protein